MGMGLTVDDDIDRMLDRMAADDEARERLLNAAEANGADRLKLEVIRWARLHAEAISTEGLRDLLAIVGSPAAQAMIELPPAPRAA